jgi:predicted permease
MLQDVRYAIRGFLRTPAFAITVIVTIGLALGLNTTLFTIFDSYVLRPFAVRDPYSLYQFTWLTRNGGTHQFTLREFEDFQSHNPVFAEAIASEPAAAFARTEGISLLGQRVSRNYFTMLGIDAAMGRSFLAEDAVVLAYGAWKEKFGADPKILGKKLVLFGSVYEVVGVARKDFNGLTQVPRDFWIPLKPADQPGLQVIGRLKPDITPRQAQAALLVWARQATDELPETQRADGIYFQSSATSIPISPQLMAGFAPILAAFGLVLLITCANIANMMLARAMARQREITVRLSLGASRLRLVRQLVTESLLVAIPAAAAGFAISEATLRTSQRLLVATMPPLFAKFIRMGRIQPDGKVFIFLVVAAVLSTIVFGLVPALQATRQNLSVRSGRLRSGLLVLQVTVCALLLICAGILLRGSRQLSERDVGLQTRGVIDVELSQALQSKIAEHLAAEPWVESIATTWHAPLAGSLSGITIAPGSAPTLIRAAYNFVSPEYFGVFRIPVVRGRNFTADEAASEAPVAIISEAAARALWPNQDSLGQTIRIEAEPRSSRRNKIPGFRSARVIGVAPDVISGVIFEGPDPALLYFPTSSRGTMNGSLLLGVKGDPEIARRTLDSLLERVAPGALQRVTPVGELLDAQIYPFRIAFAIASVLGGLALVLTLSGIYGVLSYLVNQRTKEIGIRVALGATNANVIRLVLSQSFRLTSYGIAIGVVMALGVSKVFASELSINTFDLLAYGSGIGVVLSAALAASYFPSRRAVRVDPASTLRYE